MVLKTGSRQEILLLFQLFFLNGISPEREILKEGEEKDEMIKMKECTDCLGPLLKIIVYWKHSKALAGRFYNNVPKCFPREL